MRFIDLTDPALRYPERPTRHRVGRSARLGAGLALVLVLNACSWSAPHRTASGLATWSEPSTRPSSTPSSSPSQVIDRAETVARSLDDLDLVGQVLVPFAYGDDANRVSAGSAAGNKRLGGVATPAELIAKFRLGGLILVSSSADDPTQTTNWTTNMESAPQVRTLTGGLQAAAVKLPAGAPLLIGTDQEYGVVIRMHSGIVQLPSALALGAANDPALTQKAWAAAGVDLNAIGINVDFAPDADVLGGAGNSVIGSRSFGGDPIPNSAQVAAAVRGIQSAGIAATIKHFPGHGHTTVDSHVGLPVLRQSLAELSANDLVPFRAGIAAGADLVMSGHLDVEAIDPGVPASFSHKVLTDLLRGQLGFTGVVITDSMGMEPARQWKPGEAAVRAILAGNDMLLMPPNLPAAQQGLLAALKSGRLPRQRLIDSVTRILELKFRLAATADAEPVALNSTAARALVAKAAAEAITVLKGPCSGVIATGPVTITGPSAWGRQRDWLAAALRADGVPVVDSGGSVVVRLVGYGDGTAQLGTATVTVAMDTPYLLHYATSPVLLASYSTVKPSMIAVAAVLAGRARAPGRSPVPVTGLPRSACLGASG